MSTTTEAQANSKTVVRDILLFNVANTLCGIDVLLIQEVRKDFEITPVPLAPDYVSGVMNLRGEIATVFDLGLKLGLQSEMDPKLRKVIVLKNRGGEFEGLLVDDVADVMQITGNDVNSAPGHLTSVKPEFVEGICRQDEDLVALLNLHVIFEKK
jgi:purine-binding chemotaxis protein CheW